MASALDWPINIEAQSKVVAAILTRLLESGIVPSYVAASDYKSVYAAAGYPESFDEEGLMRDLLRWLQNEEIIAVTSTQRASERSFLWECVLTAKGLRLVHTPSEILGGLTPQEVIEKSAKGDAPASGYIKAGSFLGGLFGGAIKTMSGG